MKTNLVLCLAALFSAGCASLTPNERAGLRTDGTRMTNEELAALEYRRGQPTMGGDRHGRIQAFSIDHAYADAFWKTSVKANENASGMNSSMSGSWSSEVTKGGAIIDMAGRALGVPGSISFGAAGGMFLLGALSDDSGFVKAIGQNRFRGTTLNRLVVISPVIRSSKEDISDGKDLTKGFIQTAAWLEKVAGRDCTAAVFVDPQGIYYPNSSSAYKGFSHYRGYRCPGYLNGLINANVDVRAERVDGNHPLVNSERYNVFSEVSFLLQSDLKIPLKPNAGMEAFLALKDKLPIGWVAVFPGADDSGNRRVFVADRQTVVAFEAPVDPFTKP